MLCKKQEVQSSGVTLLKVNGRTHDSPGEKADILNKQFSSEFTKKGISSLPSLGKSSYPSAPDRNIRVEGVIKILKGLSPLKCLV